MIHPDVVPDRRSGRSLLRGQARSESIEERLPSELVDLDGLVALDRRIQTGHPAEIMQWARLPPRRVQSSRGCHGQLGLGGGRAFGLVRRSLRGAVSRYEVSGTAANTTMVVESLVSIW